MALTIALTLGPTKTCWDTPGHRDRIAKPNLTLTGQVCGDSIAGTHDWRRQRLVRPGVVGPAILSRRPGMF